MTPRSLEGDPATGGSLGFPITLSAPPDPGKTVTVYWATAAGNGRLDRLHVHEGHDSSSPGPDDPDGPRPDQAGRQDESNETMYAGHRPASTAGRTAGAGHRDDLDDESRLGGAPGDLGRDGRRRRHRDAEPARADHVDAGGRRRRDRAYRDGRRLGESGLRLRRTSGTIKIAKGARQVTVTIPIVADTASAGTETFQVVVDSAPGVSIVKGTGVVTIRDDD